MSKHKDLNRPAGGRSRGGWGGLFGGDKQESHAAPQSSLEVFFATVQQGDSNRQGENFKGVDQIVVVRDTGIQQDKSDPFFAKPLNAHLKVVPVPGEKVVCVGEKGGSYYYMDVVNLNGKTNENISVKDASIIPDGSDFFFGLFTKPRKTKKMDSTEGDIIFEGRAGQSIRFTSTSEEGFLGKLFGGKSENKPVMMITCNDDEDEGLGSEDIMEDDCSIYLSSESPIKTLKLESKVDKDYEKVDEFSKNQILLRSDRLLLSSKQDNIILASADKVGISTKKWKLDIDKLMDAIEKLSTELGNLTKGQATFTTGVGPTGPATNSSNVLKIGQDIKKLKQ